MSSSSDTLSFSLCKQIEFYFGDLNLPKDKFLLSKINETDNGWVPISLISDFNRMKTLLSDVSDSSIKTSLIVSSLTNSNLIQVNEEKTCIRRSLPLSNTRDDLSSTLYVKGFPCNATLDELQLFFSELSTKPFAIRMKRLPTNEKPFKGSVYIEFGSAEEVIRLLAIIPTPVFLKNNEEYPLLFEKKIDHILKKVQKNDKESIKHHQFLKITDILEGISWQDIKNELNRSLNVSRVAIDFSARVAFIRLDPNNSTSSEVITAEIQSPCCSSIILNEKEYKLEQIVDEDEIKAAATFLEPKSFSGKPKIQKKRRKVDQR